MTQVIFTWTLDGVSVHEYRCHPIFAIDDEAWILRILPLMHCPCDHDQITANIVEVSA